MASQALTEMKCEARMEFWVENANFHAHLPIVFDCRDVIIIFGQLLPKKLPKSREKQFFMSDTSPKCMKIGDFSAQGKGN